MWEFVRKNTFAALAFTSYGAFWLLFYALINFGLPGGGSDTVQHLPSRLVDLHGVHDIGRDEDQQRRARWSLRLLSITFILLTIGNWGTTHTFNDIVQAGGWTGLATAAAAWYASRGRHECDTRSSCDTGWSAGLT